MARPNLIRQLYGYLVCLIAIITLLIASANLVGALFDLAQPDGADWSARQTFTEYRSQRLMEAKGQRSPTDTLAAARLPDDSTLRREYNETREQNRRIVHWRSLRSIVTSILLIVLAVVLFTIHWRWTRRLDSAEETHA